MLNNDNVLHDSRNTFYRSITGAAEAGSKLRLGISIDTPEYINQVLMHIYSESTGEQWKQLSILNRENSTKSFYTINIQLREQGELIWYYFIIVANDRTYYYGNNPEQLGGRGLLYDHIPPAFQITVYKKGSKTPDWFKHSIMYQIFPDRFCRDGNEIIEKNGAVFHADWNDDPIYLKDPDTKEIIFYDFFGGNLKGIKNKLDYLKELGISVIYLNPIFESESNHRYDTGDYHKVDPILGTNEDFKHLAVAAAEKGIRIILDGVFSHTGSNSKYFNRKGQYNTVGAFQSKNSPYYEWYNFEDYPHVYDNWWGFASLPNIRETTPSYMDFIIYNKDSVLKYWVRQGASGWRLDVIDELPKEFSRAFYSELKKTDPEAVIIGEVWEDASNKVAYNVQRQYLCGYDIDSAMNYVMYEAVRDFILGNIDGEFCMRRMESLRENYPAENFYAMMNLIASHDIERPLTIFAEAPYYRQMPAIDQSRYQLDEEQEKLAKARLRMIALWQMTYPGVPCIYYGDEVGMQGFKDPTNRRTYPWGREDKSLLKTYKKLIAMRNNHVALQTGDLLPLNSRDDVVAYARVIQDGRDIFGKEANNDTYVVILNRSKYHTREISFNVKDFASEYFVDAFDENNLGKIYPVLSDWLSVKIKPLEALLLHHINPPQKHKRRAGILLHVTSLPSKYGIGDLGEEAFKFIDYLSAAGQSIWQILPLNPVEDSMSPYKSPSAFAGNFLIISPEELIKEGFLKENDLKAFENIQDSSSVNYEIVKKVKESLLTKAFENFKDKLKSDSSIARDFKMFCEAQKYWLEDYALFMTLKKVNDNISWDLWGSQLKDRDITALNDLSKKLSYQILFVKFEQYIFERQWQKVHDYATQHGIKIIGDMPFFVSGDSSDVWTNQQEFQLDKSGKAKKIAGVPADDFSRNGQIWGNPQYDWTEMKKTDYKWWKLRFKRAYELVDMVRVDHFRAFISYYSIDNYDQNVFKGEWIEGVGINFFDSLKKDFVELPIIAEDLGQNMEGVEELRRKLDFPGMKVLQFALYFNDSGRIGFMSPENSVIYTGTHDNNTTIGWLTNSEVMTYEKREAISTLIGANVNDLEDICKKLIKFAYASNSRFVIIPMQDILCLGADCRMNTPGTVGGNWKWRLEKDYQSKASPENLKTLCTKYLR